MNLARDSVLRPLASRWSALLVTLLFALVWTGTSEGAPPSPPSDTGSAGSIHDSGRDSGLDSGRDSSPDSGPDSGERQTTPDRADDERGESGRTVSSPPSTADPAEAAARLRDRAAKIDELIAGTLDPDVEIAELFTVDLVADDLGGVQGVELLDLLESIHAARGEDVGGNTKATAAQREPSPDSEAKMGPAAALARAYRRFLTLPVERRAELIERHRAHRAKIAADAAAEAAARARLERLEAHAAQLEALIQGELDLEVDPRELLRIDLSATDEITAPRRLGQALGRPPPPATEAGEVPTSEAADSEGWRPGPELAAKLEEAAAKLDAQRVRLLQMSPDERRAVLGRHEDRKRKAAAAAAAASASEAVAVEQVEVQITEAEDKAAAARRERQAAEADAARARSEALRRVAEERARLLGVKEAHANFEVTLGLARRKTLAAHEVALELDRRVAELAAERGDEGRQSRADAMYGEVREALGEARDALRETLREIAEGESEVEPVGEPLAGLPQDVERGDLTELREELTVSEQTLRDQEIEARWAAAEQQRDDIVMLNKARLMLLDLATSDLRERMTGFDADGIAQARRELDQIGLELRYRVLTLPRLGRSILERLETSPLSVIFGLFKLIFVILVFRWWRGRADSVLDAARTAMVERERGHPRVNTAIAAGLWYLKRIRKPLEWLILFGVLFQVVLADAEILELEILELVLVWLLVGSTVILLVDAIAARENAVYGHGLGTGQLRIRSLRLVGLTVVFTGLILSLTEETVGRGAIHMWVRSLVWIPAIVIVLVLIRWWRVHVFRRLRNDPEIPDNALTRWLRANTEGWASFAAASLTAGYLFGRGVARWSLHQATALESTRRLLAWMFRREVARQATARREDDEGEDLRPLDPEDYAAFDPNRSVEEVARLGGVPCEVADELLEEIIALKTSGHRGTISAVVGERGSGKTAFLMRLCAKLETRAQVYEHPEDEEDDPNGRPPDARHDEWGRLTIRRLQCPPGGFDQLQRAIARAIGLPAQASREEIVAELSAQTPLVFLLDDIHRLVRPAIGGLEGLDRFADFAREVSGDTSWVASIGAAAWRYVSRARGDRVFFDQVLLLPAWTEEQIGELISQRCQLAKIQPSFDDIVIPRQFDVATIGELDQRPTEAQRSRAGYTRILWDYAKGNPAVALHFWRESLVIAPRTGDDGAGGRGVAAHEEIRVRLFEEPDAASLDEVGPTLHFVLRAVVQLELASPSDLVECTQLPPAEVADALRFALARGWLDRRDDRYEVTWRWYRAITNMLRRQHLLTI